MPTSRTASPDQRSTAPLPVTSLVGVDKLPDPIRDLSSLPVISYADQFTVTTSETASPEQWARTMFGDVPNFGEVFIWRGLLGIRLAPGKSADTVAGWRIGDRADDWIRLEANSWFLSANLIVHRASEQLSLTTLLSYDRLPAGISWPLLSRVHRRLCPGVMRDAVAAVA